MPRYRESLPQLGTEMFLTDSGLETVLIFNQGIDLPEFAAFPLLADASGIEQLRAYYVEHAAVAASAGVGFVLEAATWRASADWGTLLGFDADALDLVNRRAIDLLVDVRSEFADSGHHYPVSGCLGPRHDAYEPALLMTASDAEAYHRPQIETFADTEADLATAMTLTYPAEAIGIVVAARAAALPVVLSFTLETDGTLPDGTSLADAIEQVDDATDSYASYYMINCVHPSHFADLLDTDARWTMRLRGIRANASLLSHAELDEATELDAGDPVKLGAEYVELRQRSPALTVLGGCCGTDVRHIKEIAAACL
jgi:S-methylmethionine-dependent homocysteine/selenocysteine methylase